MLKSLHGIILQEKVLSSKMASVTPAHKGQETHQGTQCFLCDKGGGYLKGFVRWSEKERQ